MNPKRSTDLSKRLSFILRHRPGELGLEPDEAGWVPVERLLAAFAKRPGWKLSREELDAVVAESSKQRFAFSEDRTSIRANQGHSIPVELGLEALEPPELLFHGTVARFLDSIREQGLVRGSRHHVHLSAARDVAEMVGRRRGAPVVLTVRARSMAAEGHDFFLSANGVWLTAQVPPRFLELP